MQSFLNRNAQSWTFAWQSPVFRRKFIQSLTASVLILAVLPFFFDFIQTRSGTRLNDWLLLQLPTRPVSVWIFGLLWGSGAWVIWRIWQQPNLALPLLAGYFLVTLTRMATILLFPLEPPVGLLELADPISNQFYGDQFITKDLFFSGHTSSVFLFAFVLDKPREKWIIGFCGVAVGFLVLIQHVHYTIDVLVAPFATYFVVQLAKKWAAN